MNSVKTKDSTCCNCETVRNDLIVNKKGFFYLVWLLQILKTILHFWNWSSYIVWEKSHVWVSFDRQCCITMAKACHVLSCPKLYFTFYLLGTIIILCQNQAVMSSFVFRRAACSRDSSSAVILWWFMLSLSNIIKQFSPAWRGRTKMQGWMLEMIAQILSLLHYIKFSCFMIYMSIKGRGF